MSALCAQKGRRQAAGADKHKRRTIILAVHLSNSALGEFSPVSSFWTLAVTFGAGGAAAAAAAVAAVAFSFASLSFSCFCCSSTAFLAFSSSSLRAASRMTLASRSLSSSRFLTSSSSVRLRASRSSRSARSMASSIPAQRFLFRDSKDAWREAVVASCSRRRSDRSAAMLWSEAGGAGDGEAESERERERWNVRLAVDCACQLSGKAEERVPRSGPC